MFVIYVYAVSQCSKTELVVSEFEKRGALKSNHYKCILIGHIWIRAEQHISC